MQIKTKEDIIAYNNKTTEALAMLIIKDFEKTSAEMSAAEVDSPELRNELIHAHLGSYIKATGHTFSSFVSMLIDGQPEGLYEMLREKFTIMINELLDDSRKLAKEKPNESST